MRGRSRPGARALVALVLGGLLLSACQGGDADPDDAATGADGGSGAGRDDGSADAEPEAITLAFAGDVHLEGGLAGLSDRPGSTLGPMSQALRSADFAMVNLESALGSAGEQADKELEDADNRYWFRSPASALDLMERSGVDAVSLANNHGADYGATGLRDSIRVAQDSPVSVLGIGRDRAEALTPYRETIRGTDVAVFAADASKRESDDDTWAVGPGTGPGMVAARVPYAPQLVSAVEKADATDDLVVVYLHWGDENDDAPTPLQQGLAESLARAGADVVVGSHAHVLLGAGMLGDTYVGYGLGNFVWYHGRTSETGVLRLRLRGDEVVDETWVPGRIPLEGGVPQPLTGTARTAAVAGWRALRGSTGLEPAPRATPDGSGGSGGSGGGLPEFDATVRRVGPALRERMVGSSFDPATCPVPLSDLRQVALSYVGADGDAHTGAMVVAADVATDVVGVFRTLYDARFPLQRMRLIDAYDGDDDASMAANNTSGFNCRTVAGSSSFSDHAYGRAIDLNPVQNPYVVGDEVRPPAGSRFVDADRSPGADAGPGVIVRDDVVSRAFARIGWQWGGDFSDPDYQHFYAP